MSAHIHSQGQMARHPLPSPSRAALRLTKIVAAWKMRQRSRKGLALLDDHMLKDIGIDPMAANLEASKPFWRI